ncbi:unnamed protein product [Effrenium voratum]|uniref:Cyclic nucleotide-binding domain-containing protein n=1 Tax=Effrenium voratum TaxID=2562239 RepID=A0AA36MSZ0_9DINO|nr:unnamed protein product [Effrenium voratum]
MHLCIRHLRRRRNPFAQQLRHCSLEGPDRRWRFSGARLRFVQRHHAVISPISTALGHAGYIIGLLEYVVTEIWWLRVWAVLGCGLVVSFQVLQPRCQWLSAGWCSVYVLVNLFQLHWFSLSLMEPTLSDEEQKLFDLLGDIVSVREFADLAGFGEWISLAPGDLLSKQGNEVTPDDAQARLYLIAEGCCEVSIAGRTVATLHPGSLVGEVSYLLQQNMEHSSSATVTAREEVHCLAIPLHEVRQLLQRRSDLQQPFVRLLARDLLTKEAAVSDQALEDRRYKAVLEVACPMARQPGVADGVATYRRREPGEARTASLQMTTSG